MAALSELRDRQLEHICSAQAVLCPCLAGESQLAPAGDRGLALITSMTAPLVSSMDELTLEGFEKRADEAEARIDQLEHRMAETAGQEPGAV